MRDQEVGHYSDPFSGDGVDRHAVDTLFAEAYEELRRLAARVREGDPSATLGPTALVNEAWLKMSGLPGAENMSRLHFKRIAARAMRQILVEAARRRNADKRGSGMPLVTFDEALADGASTSTELLALNDALDSLGKLSPRQATMVEARFFGGLDTKETAELLQVSEATILRDWRAARAWLAVELASG